MKYNDTNTLILIDLVYLVLEVDDENEKIIGIYSNMTDIEKYKDCDNYEVESYIIQHDKSVLF